MKEDGQLDIAEAVAALEGAKRTLLDEEYVKSNEFIELFGVLVEAIKDSGLDLDGKFNDLQTEFDSLREIVLSERKLSRKLQEQFNTRLSTLNTNLLSAIGDIKRSLNDISSREVPIPKDGYTPIKGKDYFTEEDKNDIALIALSQHPFTHPDQIKALFPEDPTVKQRLDTIERIAKANQMPITTSFINGRRAKNINFTGANVSYQDDTATVSINAQADTSGLVPYTGATTDVDLGVNDLLLTGNIGTSDSRVANGYFTNLSIPSGGTATFSSAGSSYLTAGNASLKFYDGSGNYISLVGSSIGDETNKTITLPNATGTVALTSDIPAAGANTALSNLASVAINTSLLLGTSDGGALGSATKQWSDLFLAEGGVINWDNGDATLTQVGNEVTLAGATFKVSGNQIDIDNSSAYPVYLKMNGFSMFEATSATQLTFNAAGWGTVQINQSRSATTLGGAGGGLYIKNTDATASNTANIAIYTENGSNGVAIGSRDNELIFATSTSWTEKAYLGTSDFRPATSDGLALGTSTNMWSDLFLASGGVINWNNGNVTLTHSAANLTLGGASNANLIVNNGYAWIKRAGTGAGFYITDTTLASNSSSWGVNTNSVGSLELTTLNNGLSLLATPMTITRGGNLSVTGSLVVPATLGVYLDGGSNTYITESSADNVQIVTGGISRLDIGTSLTTAYEFHINRANNTNWLDLYSTTSNQHYYFYPMPTTGNLSLYSNAADRLVIDYATGSTYFGGTIISPVTSDGTALGSTSLMWSDLFLASGGVINWNNGDVTLTHSSNFLTLAGGDLVMPTLYLAELSADPSDPAEGKSVLWQSDGTGFGDDGDIIMKITAGGVTKTVTIVDFSTV